jgi:NAD(P)-dependent dehydrogenase (short-subunit alcohol dehydrogenase family)
MSVRLAGKVAVVTGGASGIGRATSLRFSAEGASVAIFDRNASKGAEVLREIREGGNKAIFLPVDISSEVQIKESMRKVEAEFGALHILVNNAAAFVFGSYDVTQADWEKVLSVNVMGTAFCAKHAVEPMIRAGGGSIVNVSSISGFVAQEKSLPYNTSKAALLGLTRGLAMDLAAHKIRVNAVAPGCIDTPQLRADAARMGMTYEEDLALEGPLHILNRFGTAEEVANSILFLASDEASFVTGACLMVDGGYTAK